MHSTSISCPISAIALFHPFVVANELGLFFQQAQAWCFLDFVNVMCIFPGLSYCGYCQCGGIALPAVVMIQLEAHPCQTLENIIGNHCFCLHLRCLLFTCSFLKSGLRYRCGPVAVRAESMFYVTLREGFGRMLAEEVSARVTSPVASPLTASDFTSLKKNM